MVTNVFAAMTKDCCDFFFFFFFLVQMPGYFTAENVKPLSYCDDNWPCHESISGLFFCCYAVSIIDSE